MNHQNRFDHYTSSSSSLLFSLSTEHKVLTILFKAKGEESQRKPLGL